MTRILLAVSTKHGATRDIADAMACRLRSTGYNVAVSTIERANDLDHYDAVIIGSAVYAGHWMAPTRRFVKHNSDVLANRPVWLFSSGPLGEGSPEPDPLEQVEAFGRDLGAREHRVFAGRLDPDNLGIGERLIVRAMHEPEGDFIEWDQVFAWTDEIANELSDIETTAA